jgi:hypothetical protein
VGEEVALTFSEGNANWSVSGNGRLSVLQGGAGSSVSYFAPDTASTDTITAKGAGCTAEITFTIVPPSSVHQVRVTAVEHSQGFPDIGMRTEIYLGPDNVSFYNTQFHELEVGAAASGVYSCLNGSGHHPNPNPLPATTTVTGGLGTKMAAQDHCYSGHCGKPGFFTNSGSEQFDIPWEYQVGSSGKFYPIATATQLSTCLPSGALSISKAGATGDTTINSPTVTI